MNHKSRRHIWRLGYALAFCIATSSLHSVYAQCSPEALTAKYWQYRKNLKHFIAIDRDSSGCVHDGIGQDPVDPCSCSKEGFSLPATSINMHKFGGDEQQDRGQVGSLWYDPSCYAPVSSESTPPDQITHNVLDMGSETPHQMGYYWLMLASEYAMLQSNGQEKEAQRTLEELFLGLQAYRRLDIRANCIAKKRYDEMAAQYATNGGAPMLICDDFYGQGQKKWNFDTFYNPDCTFTPQTDGYSGFYIREDATQALEPMLHDGSEDRWNIDAVKSDYANSLTPPCTPQSWYNQACYLLHRQDFMSQDGVIGFLIGLAAIKRFIPRNAKVTTCEGQDYYPLDIATKIAAGLTNRLDHAYLNYVEWPGAHDCLDKVPVIAAPAGGCAEGTIRGIKKACNYIDGGSRRSNLDETAFFGGLMLQNSFSDNTNERFWMRLKTLGWDMGNDAHRNLYNATATSAGLQILPVLNNLLYPAPPNLSIDKQVLKDMLCSAPCGGPCFKKEGYPDGVAGEPQFSCPNTPGWLGQRWEGGGNSNNGLSRQFNGLDYMTLYNLYLLYFPEERTSYFNPDRPEGTVSLNRGSLEGPDALCPVQTGHYQLLNPNPTTVEHVAWKTSENLQVLSKQGLTADIRANTALYPSFIQASYQQNQALQQYYNGVNGQWVIPPPVGDPEDPNYTPPVASWQSKGTCIDVCAFTCQKPIDTRAPMLTFHTDISCSACEAHLDGNGFVPGNVTISWTAEETTTHASTSASNTADFSFCDILQHTAGHVIITLKVQNDCGTYTNYIEKEYPACSNHGGIPRQVIVSPNPGRTSVNVGVSNNYTIGAGGLDVTFIRTGFGTTQSIQRIYYNGQAINIASFPPGNYTVQVILDDNSVLSTTLVVSDN